MDPGLMPNLRRVTRRHGLLPECRLKIDRSESQLSPTNVGVEKVVARDGFRRELIAAEAWQDSSRRLSGDRRRPGVRRAQESDQAFDVLRCGGHEELLLTELQPAQAEAM